MKTIIFHIGKHGHRFSREGGHLICKGYGTFDDMLDMCGVDIHIEDGKMYTDGGHYCGDVDDSAEIDLDGIYDTWYVKSVECLTEEECMAAVDYGLTKYDFEH